MKVVGSRNSYRHNELIRYACNYVFGILILHLNHGKACLSDAFWQDTTGDFPELVYNGIGNSFLHQEDVFGWSGKYLTDSRELAVCG